MSGIEVITQELSPAEYHLPLAILVLGDALRLSCKADEVAEIAGFKGDLTLTMVNRAFHVLGELGKRDGELAALRSFNVLRLGGKLSNLALRALSSLAQTPGEYWTWLAAQRTLDESSSPC